MSTVQLPDGAPAVPAKVRTVAYYVGLGVGGATTLAGSLAAALTPHAAVVVLAVCGAVNGAALLVLGGLGVAFRPTAGLPSTRSADTWGDGTPVSGPVIGPS